jgi:hypothetical protein
MSSLYSGTSSYADFFTIPDDGDAINASSFNVAFEALGDRTRYLLDNLNTLDAFVVATATSMSTDIAALKSFRTAVEAYSLVGVVIVDKFTNSTMGISLTNGGTLSGNTGAILSKTVKAGDNAQVTFTSSFNFHMAALADFSVLIELQYQEAGGGYNTLINCSQNFSFPSDVGISGDYSIPFAMTGQHAVGVDGTLDWRLKLTLTSSGVGDTLTANNPYHSTIVVYRGIVYP